RSFPEQPEKDVLLFLIEHAPIKPWQRDILSIIRDEAYYFMPQGMTKIMNEGWACVNFNTLLCTDEGFLPAGEIVERRRAVGVADGEKKRKVYDWAMFPDRETVTIRTRRGLELGGSVTHRVRLPDGNWRRLDELKLGERVQLAAGTDLWARDYVRLDWTPRERMTL